MLIGPEDEVPLSYESDTKPESNQTQQVSNQEAAPQRFEDEMARVGRLLDWLEGVKPWSTPALSEREGVVFREMFKVLKDGVRDEVKKIWGMG